MKIKNFSKLLLKKKNYSLNNEQNIALKDLKKSGNNFNVSVLQGVTGSGKTIVYFERIKEMLKKKKQVLSFIA